MLLNCENANVTLERPLYLLTLEAKIGRKMENSTFLSPQGGGSCSSRNQAVSRCLWDLTVSHYPDRAEGGCDD